MPPVGFENKVAFVWRVADTLRGTCKQHEYGSVMLPLLVLRRMDAVLAPTKDAVLAKAAGMGDIGPGQDMMLKAVAGQRFYNTSPLTVTSLLADDKNLAAALAGYVRRLSSDAYAVMEAYSPAQQSVLYAHLSPAVGRFVALEEDAQELFRGRLQHFARAYAFVAQVMPGTDPDLERLFLYGKALLTELPTGDTDPMPQLSKSVQLTHLRLAVTSEAAIPLVAGDEPGVALPGEGRGRQADPVLDRLSALIAVMNDKFGADLDDGDRVWVDQQWVVVKLDDDLRTVALHNDRSQYELVLEERIKELLVDRQDTNGQLFDTFFANVDFKDMILHYLGGTYDEFRREAATARGRAHPGVLHR